MHLRGAQIRSITASKCPLSHWIHKRMQPQFVLQAAVKSFGGNVMRNVLYRVFYALTEGKSRRVWVIKISGYSFNSPRRTKFSAKISFFQLDGGKVQIVWLTTWDDTSYHSFFDLLLCLQNPSSTIVTSTKLLTDRSSPFTVASAAKLLYDWSINPQVGIALSVQ